MIAPDSQNIDFEKMARDLDTHAGNAEVLWRVWLEAKTQTKFQFIDPDSDPLDPKPKIRTVHGDEAIKLYFSQATGLPTKIVNSHLRRLPKIEAGLQQYLKS